MARTLGTTTVQPLRRIVLIGATTAVAFDMGLFVATVVMGKFAEPRGDALAFALADDRDVYLKRPLDVQPALAILFEKEQRREEVDVDFNCRSMV